MRQQLIRSTVLAVSLAIVITMAPVGFAIWRASVRGRGPVAQWLDAGTPASTSMRLGGVVIALGTLFRFWAYRRFVFSHEPLDDTSPLAD